MIESKNFQSNSFLTPHHRYMNQYVKVALFISKSSVTTSDFNPI